MLSNYLPTPDLHDAPPIIRQLREAFDGQLERLHSVAVQLQRSESASASSMVHVPFQFEQFDVEAMYDTEQDLFTQLVARPIGELGSARPAYTISLFLVAHTAKESAAQEW